MRSSPRSNGCNRARRSSSRASDSRSRPWCRGGASIRSRCRGRSFRGLIDEPCFKAIFFGRCVELLDQGAAEIDVLRHRDQVDADHYIGQFLCKLLDGSARTLDAETFARDLLDDVACLADLAREFIAAIFKADAVFLVPFPLPAEIGEPKQCKHHSPLRSARQRAGISNSVCQRPRRSSFAIACAAA